MKRASILAVLLASALASGQKFEVTDVSPAWTPVSFHGKATVSRAGTACVVTMHNNSTQSLLAVEATGEFTAPTASTESMGFSYDGFFKEAGIPAGADFDVVGPEFFDSDNHGTIIVNGVVKPQEPKKDLFCHAAFKVKFVQLEDGSMLGDYAINKDVTARRAKKMIILSHLVDTYDKGGEAALAAALDEPESRSMAYQLKYMVNYF